MVSSLLHPRALLFFGAKLHTAVALTWATGPRESHALARGAGQERPIHKPRTLYFLLIQDTACCKRFSNSPGVSSQGLTGRACSSKLRNQDTAVSCNRKSATSGGCARGPLFEFVPAQGLNPCSRQADS